MMTTTTPALQSHPCAFNLSGNGEIDFEEFLQMMAKKTQESDSDAEIQEAFHLFDKDADGFLSAKDLKQVSFVYQYVSHGRYKYKD